MPVKFTWKSITGLLSLAAGAVTSAQSTVGLPHWASAALIGTGGVILAAERVADAVDFRTTSFTNAYPAVTKQVEAAVAPVVDKVETAVDTEKAKILAEHPNLSDEITAARAKANVALAELENLGKLADTVQVPSPATVQAADGGAETVAATTI